MSKPQADSFWDFRHDIDMRVVLDPICDEIMRRVKNPVIEPEAPEQEDNRDGEIDVDFGDQDE